MISLNEGNVANKAWQEVLIMRGKQSEVASVASVSQSHHQVSISGMLIGVTMSDASLGEIAVH